MSWWRGRKYFKDRTARILGLDRLPRIDGFMMFSGIQAAGGAALAYYLFEEPTYRVLPYMCSAVAVVGTYNVLKVMNNTAREKKNVRRSINIEMDRLDCRKIMHRSAWNLVSGALTYFTNVYAFSEALKNNDKMWILSAAVAASGYYFTVSFVDNLETNFHRRPILNYCQLIFEPALIAATSTYLLYFRNHEEDFLYFLPFVLIAATGFKISNRGFKRAEYELIPKIMLLRAIEMLTGGFLLTLGSAVMTIYTSVNDFNMLCIVSAVIASFLGAFIIFGSITCFRRYLDLDRDVFFSIVGMITGPFTFLASCLLIKFVEDTYMAYFICLFLGGFGHVLVLKSVLNLYMLVPRPVVYRYCQRVLGPMLMVYSTLATGCVGYRMGWKFSMATLPFIPAGIYATYKGFRRRDELQ